MIRKIVVVLFSFFFIVPLFAQITTALDYFKTVSDYYATIKDYEADMNIKAGRQNMTAHVSFKKPDLLRIDFSNPAEQVILFNGDMLTIYLPGASAVLQQSAEETDEQGFVLATPNGLSLMSRYYTISYESTPNAHALDESSDEQVVTLSLNRKNTSEAFRTIVVAINAQTKLIRRMTAITPPGEKFVFDFSNYKLNQNIPDQRFIYDAPSSANVYNNFLLAE